MKKKFHPAAWILRSRANPSSTLTKLQSPKQGSVSRLGICGIPGHSFIRIVPASTVDSIRVVVCPFPAPILDRWSNKNCSKVTTLATSCPHTHSLRTDESMPICAIGVIRGLYLQQDASLDSS